MKNLRLNFHLLQPHVVPFTRLHANTNSEKAKGPVAYFRRILIDECTDDIE